MFKRKRLSLLLYIVLVVKTLIICVLGIAVRGTVPRYRFDQITQLNWKHFVFFWISFLLCSVFLIFLLN